MALAEGKTWKFVQDDIGVANTTLARWKKAPEFQARIDEHIEAMVGEARRILNQYATRAAKTVAELTVIGLPGHSTRLAAAKDILDRVGLKPVEKQQVQSDGALTIRWIEDDGTDDQDT